MRVINQEEWEFIQSSHENVKYLNRKKGGYSLSNNYNFKIRKKR